MKIKYVHHGKWPDDAPASTFVTFSTLGFSRIGAEFELVTKSNTDKPVGEVLSEDFNIRELLPIHLLNGKLLGGKHRVIHILAFWYLLFQDFDVLLTRNLNFLPFAFVLRKFKKVKVVFESHDFYADLSIQDPKIAKRRKKQSRQERRYIPHVDLVLGQSEHNSSLYRDYFPKVDVETAVSGVKTLPGVRAKKVANSCIGYIGSMDGNAYDVERVFKILSLLPSNIRGLFIGAKNENEKAYMKSLAKEYRVSDRVTIKGWVTPAEVELYKEKIDIGLCPSRKNERNKLNTPLKVLEYFSSGIPVLFTNLGAEGFIVENDYNGALLPEDAESWAAKILDIYSSKDRLFELSSNCLVTAEKYSWENRARTICRHFESKF